MKFNQARWNIQASIFWTLEHRKLPYSLEFSLWLTHPQTIWHWIIGALTKIGVLDFP